MGGSPVLSHLSDATRRQVIYSQARGGWSSTPLSIAIGWVLSIPSYGPAHKITDRPLMRYVPEISTHLEAALIRLLPIEQRSRVGSGRHRRIRSDAGSQKPS